MKVYGIDFTIFFLQFFAAGAMLIVGSYYDLKKHEVGNDLWLLGGAVGVILLFTSINESILLGIALIPFALISIGGFVAWNFGFIGAADIKAMMALSLLIGYYSFVTVFAAVLFASFYSLAKFAKVGFKDIKKLEAPFVPFIFAGLVLVVGIYFWI